MSEKYRRHRLTNTIQTHLDLHPLFKTLPMKNVVARSKHVACTIVDIDFIVADYAVQSWGFTRSILAHWCSSDIFCPRTKPCSVAPSTSISCHAIPGGRRITVQQWHKLDFGRCRVRRIICQSREKSRRNGSAVVELRRQESFAVVKSIGELVTRKNHNSRWILSRSVSYLFGIMNRVPYFPCAKRIAVWRPIHIINNSHILVSVGKSGLTSLRKLYRKANT